MVSALLALAGLAAGPAASTVPQSRYVAHVEISVTDRTGAPLPSAHITVRGLSDREGTTNPAGQVVLTDLPAGIYALRAERAAYIPLEMKFTVKGGDPVSVVAALSPTQSPAIQGSAASVSGAYPQPAAAPSATLARLATGGLSGSPRVLSIPDFAERQLIGQQALQESPISCAGLAAARLIQVREPLREHAHLDADEMLYVVAGDAVLRVGDTEQRVSPGWFGMVPRGTEHSLSRKGRNPAIVLSMTAGQPCP